MTNEQNEKMGRFINELRKAKSMTQKELAEKMNVTDKAVSKWERGISCPDVSLLIPLAELLEITTSELLNGEKNSDSKIVEETTVVEALRYSDRSNALRTEKIRRNLLGIISLFFAIAIFVCVICDICISGRLTWSGIVISSLVFSWILLLPLLKVKERIIQRFLIVLSIAILPYLFVLSKIIGSPLTFKLGIWISIISLLWLWGIYLIFLKLRNRKFLAAGISLFLEIPIMLGINKIITVVIKDAEFDIVNNTINMLSVMLLAVICFSIDYFIHKRN